MVKCLFSWIEKNGLADASVDKLKKILKKIKLRRVIYEISAPQGAYCIV